MEIFGISDNLSSRKLMVIYKKNDICLKNLKKIKLKRWNIYKIFIKIINTANQMI